MRAGVWQRTGRGDSEAWTSWLGFGGCERRLEHFWRAEGSSSTPTTSTRPWRARPGRARARAAATGPRAPPQRPGQHAQQPTAAHSSPQPIHRHALPRYTRACPPHRYIWLRQPNPTAATAAARADSAHTQLCRCCPPSALLIATLNRRRAAARRPIEPPCSRLAARRARQAGICNSQLRN